MLFSTHIANEPTSMHFRTTKAAIAAATILSFFAPLAVSATVTLANNDLTVGSAVYRVMRGSVHDSLVVEDGKLKIVVPAGEAAEIRTIGNTLGFENDAGLPVCNVLQGNVNQIVLNGPVTATIFPAISQCTTTGSSSDNTSMFSFSVPMAGETVKAGTIKQIFWSLMGHSVASVRLRLSTDGGNTYPTTLVASGMNDGFLNWNIPADTYTTTQARLKIEGYDQGRIVAFAVSEAFTIDGVPAPTGSNGGITVEPYDYDPATETQEAETIGVNMKIGSNTAPFGSVTCQPDSRIKMKGDAAVYYCGKDGKRYVFPNKKTHDTWYSNFNGVIELTVEEMGKIPLGGNVTYRPGARLVKVTSAPDVFAVAADGTLRYVTEAVATRLYGPNWNTKIDDIPDAFFTDYVIGEPIK